MMMSFVDMVPPAVLVFITIFAVKALLSFPVPVSVSASASHSATKVVGEEEEEEDCMSEESIDQESEEAKAYLRAFEETDGFDVPFTSRAVSYCQTTPCYPGTPKLRVYAEGAIDVYNHQCNTAYKVVKVVKAMEYSAAGDVYLITFVATSDDAQTLKTFEAKVYEGLRYIPQYLFIRLKGANEQDTVFGPYDRDLI